MIKNNRIFISLPYNLREAAKMVPGYQWHGEAKMWSFPIVSIERVKSVAPWASGQLDEEVKEFKEKRNLAAYKMAELREDLRSDDSFDLDTALSDVKGPYSFFMQPYEHQLKMIKCGLKYDKWAFFAEMGTGKSKVIIDIIRLKKIKKSLIVCPKSVMYSWINETVANSDLQAILIKGTSKKRTQLLDSLFDSDTSIAVINYEGLLASEKWGGWGKFDCVVLDESSRIKNHMANRTKIIIKNFVKTTHKYILSGTPITNSPQDIFTQFKFLSKDYLGFSSFYAFRNTYCRMGGYGNYQIVGYQNLDALKKDISRYSLSIKKEDCLDLPEKVYSVREIDMSTELKKQYEDMKKQNVLELENEENITANICLTRMLRMQQILSGQWLEKKNNEKLKALEEALDEAISSDDSVVVWIRFRATYVLVRDLCISKGYSYSSVTGATKDSGLEIKNFQDGKTKVIICQISAGGFGITLTKSSISIYYENDFSLENRKQSEDRIHRIGQKNICRYIDLVYRKSLDEKVLQAIKKKQDIAIGLIDSFKKGEY